MARISVRSFSCLQEADIDLKPVTILIGPQASGKSVLSKLIYFFSELILKPFSFYGLEQELSGFQEEACDSFKKLFPPPAWGSLGFSIIFEVGPIKMEIYRNKPRSSKSIGNLRLSLGSYFDNFYSGMVAAFDEIKQNQAQTKKKDHVPSTPPWEINWKLQNKFRAELQKDLESDYTGFLLFIPAGRALFTIMGKAIAAFERDGFLDHFTREFGMRLLQVRDQSGFIYSFDGDDDHELTLLRDAFALELFGGKLISDRGEEYIETIDGRRIPFAVLSSGQQELYPLWEALKSLTPSKDSSTIFIEEPEAHLFPSAQSRLVSFFAATLRKNTKQRMMITTHSPYVLAKFNNLIKASQLSQNSKERALLVEKVVPRDSWLRPNSVVAYCIENKCIKKIMDEGLIDAVYLDDVSGDIADEFTKLLQIEAA